jgi:hypothetical protein
MAKIRKYAHVYSPTGWKTDFDMFSGAKNIQQSELRFEKQHARILRSQ